WRTTPAGMLVDPQLAGASSAAHRHASPGKPSTVGYMQPSRGSQIPVVPPPPSLHDGGAPAVHTPAWQVSAPLHRFPSGHGVPSATAACWQPALGSHVSVVQELPSSQAFVNTQPVAGSQVSVVHAFPSSQT